MTPKKALEILRRYTPCSHTCSDAIIGIGGYWARCEDCGVIFERSNWKRSLKAALEFNEAISIFTDMVDHQQ